MGWLCEVTIAPPAKTGLAGGSGQGMNGGVSGGMARWLFVCSMLVAASFIGRYFLFSVGGWGRRGRSIEWKLGGRENRD